MVSRRAHRPEVISLPRLISSGGALLFLPESDSVSGVARFLPVSRGTWELKIREGSHSTSLLCSPIRLGRPISLCAKSGVIHNSRCSPYVSRDRQHIKFELIAYARNVWQRNQCLAFKYLVWLNVPVCVSEAH